MTPQDTPDELTDAELARFGWRSRYGAIVVFSPCVAILAWWTLPSSNMAFVAGSLSLFLACVVGTIAAFTWSRVLFGFAAAFAAVAALSVPMFHSHVRAFEERAAPTISALETYRATHGSYPARERGQWETVAGIPLPACPDGRPAWYRASEETPSRSFVLTCYTFGFNKHEYRSELGRWIDWD